MANGSTAVSTVDDSRTWLDCAGRSSSEPANGINTDCQLAITSIAYYGYAVANNNVVVSRIKGTSTSTASLVTNQNVVASCGKNVTCEVTERSVCITSGILESLGANGRVESCCCSAEESLLTEGNVLSTRSVTKQGADTNGSVRSSGVCSCKSAGANSDVEGSRCQSTQNPVTKAIVEIGAVSAAVYNTFYSGGRRSGTAATSNPLNRVASVRREHLPSCAARSRAIDDASARLNGLGAVTCEPVVGG